MDQFILQDLVEETSITYFKKPFNHKVCFNPRLRTTGGRYILQTHNIELNEKYYKELGFEELVQIVKHELCHYHLHLEKKGYKHRDRDFRELLQKVDAPRFCNTLPSQEKKRAPIKYHYVCSNCKQRYDRKRKVNLNKYVCGKCQGKLREII
jgi:SprT-like protein